MNVLSLALFASYRKCISLCCWASALQISSSVLLKSYHCQCYVHQSICYILQGRQPQKSLVKVRDYFPCPGVSPCCPSRSTQMYTWHTFDCPFCFVSTLPFAAESAKCRGTLGLPSPLHAGFKKEEEDGKSVLLLSSSLSNAAPKEEKSSSSCCCWVAGGGEATFGWIVNLWNLLLLRGIRLHPILHNSGDGYVHFYLGLSSTEHKVN